MKQILTEAKAEHFLSRFKLPIAQSQLVQNQEQALQYAKKIGYPVVLKLISKEVLHKTEAHGVRVADDQFSLIREFDSLLKVAKRLGVKLDGILVQEHVPGREVIIGIKKDPIFGHVIMFGLGGIFVEILKDVTFRVCPIDDKDIESMISDLKAKQVLYGVRGEKPINFKLLKNTLSIISKIPKKNPNIEELDINPMILNEKSGKIADARIILS
ncbi:acetate--CoA ligase family protein [Candidatus Woesearchaeota archaeon]|nr:acetate--CoA ligase family protein [Candidatus Woesearchaeota archaeon]